MGQKIVNGRESVSVPTGWNNAAQVGLYLGLLSPVVIAVSFGAVWSGSTSILNWIAICLGLLGCAMIVLGVIFSAIGLARARRGAGQRGLAIAGLVLGIAEMAVVIIVGLLIAAIAVEGLHGM